MPHCAAPSPEILAAPTGLPPQIRNYIRHVQQGVPIRQIARDNDCHASTVLRQIQRVEAARDDVLVDAALDALARSHPHETADYPIPQQELSPMDAATTLDRETPKTNDAQFQLEATRLLRRLAEPGACMAIAKNMEKAVVVRETMDGRTVRTAVTDRAFAQGMAIRDWLVCSTSGQVTRYRITNTGRAALRRFIAESQGDDANVFADQHRSYAGEDAASQRPRARHNLAESPVQFLSRRKGPDGAPFLNAEMVSAAERLREDFELSQMGPRVTQNWDNFLSAGAKGTSGDVGHQGGSDAARRRVAIAMTALGPGLADVALRVCCFLEGLETTEKRLGWSARSAKVVLRIALDRLHQHYQSRTSDAMIG